MGKRTASIIVVMLLTSVWAWSASAGAEENLPCANELARYCKGVRPGGGRLIKCLKEHENDLTSTCREKIALIERMVDEARRTCAADTEKFCKDIQFGEGRIARCLMEHAEEISPACREKIHGMKQQVPENKTSDQ